MSAAPEVDVSASGARAAPAAPAASGSVAALLAADADDESLRRYKAQLLGGAAGAASSASAAAGARVTVHCLRLQVAGRPPIELACGDAAARAALAAAPPLIVAEGAEYRPSLLFTVEGSDVVLGLVLRTVISNGLGIPLERQRHMLGSYPPDGARVEAELPRAAWPAGMLARGTYYARSTVSDDDGNTHLDAAWRFTIARQWPAAAPP